MIVLYENRYFKVLYLASETLFKTEWIENEDFEDADFIEITELLASLLKEYKPVNFLADISNFGYSIAPEMQEWHNQILFPLFKEIKLRKMAVVNAKSLFAQVSVEQTYEEIENHSFITQYFESESLALAWLKE